MRAVFKYLVIYIILTGCTLVVSAMEYVKLTQINTDHGLNQSSITGLLQDQEGYLWISSHQGVNRFDGYRVTKVASPDNVLLNNYIDYIYEDSTGLIWIGAAPKNNYILDKTNNSLSPIDLTAPESASPELEVINTITETDRQDLWIATRHNLFFYDRKQDKFEFITTINSLFENIGDRHYFRALLLVGDQLLIGTSNGLYALDINTRQSRLISHTPLSSKNEYQNNVKGLFLNQAKAILVGTVEGLYQVTREALLNKEPAENYFGSLLIGKLNIWQLIEKNDFYWIATDQGLYQWFKSGDLKFIFKFSDTPFSTSDDDIVSLIEDREGNLWFGSRGDGIFKWRPNASIKQHFWQLGQAGKKLSNNMVTAIHQTPDNTVWIGTQNGLNAVDPLTQNITNILVNPDEKAVTSESSIYTIAHNKNKLWLNTYAGIQAIDQSNLKRESFIFPSIKDKLFEKPAYHIYFFDQDNLAILNEDGLYNYNLSGNQVSLIESTDTQGQISKRLVYVFDTDTGDRNTYFVGGVDRLVKFSRDTGLITDFHQLPASDNSRAEPGDLYRDGNKLWVTYPGYGIFILDVNTGKEIKFMSERSLNANTVMDIFPDTRGNLWFSSNEGLVRINKSNYNLRIFNSDDGFATSEFNGGSKQILKNGEVYLGTVKGAFRFSPDESIDKSQRNILTHITGMTLLSDYINERYGNYDNYHVKLNHDDFGLKLEFSALLFDKPEQVKYRYRIEGDSAVESTVIDKSELFLPTFETGENLLHISAIDYETGTESPPATIRITSYPAPWVSIQAYTVYVLLLILIVSLYLRRKNKMKMAKIRAHQRLKQSEERLNLALKGGNSGLWDWHASNNSVYEPRLTMENSDDGNHIILFDQRLQSIHAEDRENIIAIWHSFLKKKRDVFDVVYRMKNKAGNWAWYRDMATVSQYDGQNNPIRVTGTFTDITERKQARDKMRLFSKAFENTRDIVFVLDQNKVVIAANRAFYKTTEYESKRIVKNGVSFLTDLHGNRKLIVEIFQHINLHRHWEGEGQLIRKSKSPLPVLINATDFLDNDKNQHFVFALTDISKQKLAENELRKLANYDSLTDLPNRTLLLDRISHAIEHCRRRKQRLALFFVDLDRFKQINDTLGHDIGDLLLINVAHTLRRSIRHDDTVARLGGDEFVVMLEDIDGIDSINRIAQNILDQMKVPMHLRENQIAVSPSIGIAIYPNDGEQALSLLKHADIAMYHAKNAGRNNFQYFENSMNLAAKKRLKLENKLREGVENREFYLVYQPQYEISSGKLCGMEALARWKTRSGETIPPSEFIPIAEDLGLIIQLTEVLLESAISNMSRWHYAGIDIALAFNLSARHLHHYDFNHFLDELLSRYCIDTHLLEFELTESVLMEDVELAQRIFGKLAEKGIELALDDFGTGYSSLKYLNQLPINKLKIDRSFVSRIGTSNENDAIIKTIISLAKSLNLKTVAEGIETEEQLTFLRQSGANQAQGYLFSKPLPLEELEILLKKH